jgi:hypothetical protein
VLKRPDAEHLIMGLNSGAFSLETIVHQLSNPALQVLLQHEINFLIYKNDSSWGLHRKSDICIRKSASCFDG